MSSVNLPDDGTRAAIPPLRRPLRIVNVTGVGRSGSTVLGQILARGPDAVFVGEAQYLWGMGYRDDRLCGCGHPFSTCPLWSAVDVEAFDGGLDRRLVEPLIAAHKDAIRRRHLAGVLRPPVLRARRTEAVQRSLDYRAAAYRAVATVSGADLIVDISKEPSYGLLLCGMPETEVHVVHLLRDPRAVAFSWQRRVRNPAVTDRVVYMPQPSVRRVGEQWVTRTLSITTALRSQATSYTEVRYEDLVDRPAEAVDRIRHSIGVGAAGSDLVGPDGVIHLADLGHPISSNPRSRAGSRHVVLRADDEWRNALSRRDELTVVGLCGPLMVRHGYPLGRAARRAPVG